jgi:hypothetical protein
VGAEENAGTVFGRGGRAVRWGRSTRPFEMTGLV